MRGGAEEEQSKEEKEQRITLKSHPEEIEKMVLFLGSSDATYTYLSLIF